MTLLTTAFARYGASRWLDGWIARLRNRLRKLRPVRLECGIRKAESNALKGARGRNDPRPAMFSDDFPRFGSMSVKKMDHRALFMSHSLL